VGRNGLSRMNFGRFNRGVLRASFLYGRTVGGGEGSGFTI